METLQGFNAADIAKTAFGKGEQNNVTALATWIAAESKGGKFNLPQAHAKERVSYEVGKRLFFQRGGPHDFSCASCHGQEGTRIQLQRRHDGRFERLHGWQRESDVARIRGGEGERN
jgi:sulfur-oxidizing protein SoxA